MEKELENIYEELEEIKMESIEGAVEALDLAIRATFSSKKKSADETKLIIHMNSWIGELRDYQDKHCN